MKKFHQYSLKLLSYLFSHMCSILPLSSTTDFLWFDLLFLPYLSSHTLSIPFSHSFFPSPFLTSLPFTLCYLRDWACAPHTLDEWWWWSHTLNLLMYVPMPLIGSVWDGPDVIRFQKPQRHNLPKVTWCLISSLGFIGEWGHLLDEVTSQRLHTDGVQQKCHPGRRDSWTYWVDQPEDFCVYTGAGEMFFFPKLTVHAICLFGKKILITVFFGGEEYRRKKGCEFTAVITSK